MMVNNSTNINKTITSHLKSLNMKKQRNVFGNPDLGLGQAKICGRVKPVNGIPPPPLGN